MAYKVKYGRAYKKEFKKVRNSEHLAAIAKECSDIFINPTKPTPPLQGALGEMFRYRHIRDTIPEYRIFFAVYDCGLDVLASPPYCAEEDCEVGRIDSELDEAEDEPNSEEQQPSDDIAVDLSESDQAIAKEPCSGLIKMAVFGTREFFNNFYKLPAKQQAKYL